MEQGEFFRLSSTIVADDHYDDKPDSIKLKILESIFMSSDEEQIALNKLCEICKDNNFFVFSHDEIEQILTANHDYIRHHGTKEFSFSLRIEKKVQLQTYYKENNMDYYISKFHGENDINDKIKLEEFKTIVYKFLFFTMNNNLLEFRKISDKEFSVKKETNIGLLFSDFEKELINNFLNWDMNNKNILIFKLANIGLEYSILSNSDKYETFESLSMRSKTFYLDTNIIFRALGLNGENRKKRILQFLENCIKTKQKIAISNFSHKEFIDSIDYHTSRIEKYKVDNIKLFHEYSSGEDLYLFYYDWKLKHPSLGISSFKVYIKTLYKELRDKYDISFNESYKISELDEIGIRVLDRYSLEIDKHKNKAKYRNDYYIIIPQKSVIDAQNIFQIEKDRSSNNQDFHSCEYFLISTDHHLLDWDHDRKEILPIVLLPSHWLALSLRFFTRTNDDFNSFVNFINLPQYNEIINNEDLHLILSGIDCVAENNEDQEDILKELINEKFRSIIKSRKPEKIFERTQTRAKQIIKKSINESKYELRKKEEENKELNETIENQKKALVTDKKTNVDLQKEIDDLRIINKEIKRQERENRIIDKITNWNNRGYIFLLISIALIFSIIMIFNFDSLKWNFMKTIYTSIDTMKSQTKQGLSIAGLVVLYSTFLFFVLKQAFIRLVSKSAKIKYKQSLEFPNG